MKHSYHKFWFIPEIYMLFTILLPLCYAFLLSRGGMIKKNIHTYDDHVAFCYTASSRIFLREWERKRVTEGISDIKCPHPDWCYTTCYACYCYQVFLVYDIRVSSISPKLMRTHFFLLKHLIANSCTSNHDVLRKPSLFSIIVTFICNP